jgi:hypothetical protein
MAVEGIVPMARFTAFGDREIESNTRQREPVSQKKSDHMASESHRQFAFWTAVPLMIISQLGFLIYGAIYWHSITDSFGKIHRSETCDLPLLVDLAQYTWILALIVPGVAPAVCAIAVIHHTSESQCTMHQQMFEEQYLTGMNPEFSQYWNNYIAKRKWTLNWTGQPFTQWFWNRCGLPHLLFALFLGMFLYVVLVILITFIYIWTRTDPPVAKPTG